MIASVLDNLELAQPVCREWDRLAVAAARPFSAPAWALAWWATMRPAEASMRVIAVSRDESLVGVLPLLAEGHSYRPIGGDLAAVEPLAESGLEGEVAAAMAAEIASLQPRARRIALQGHDDGEDWAELLCSQWPARGAWQRVAERVEVPGIDLGSGDFDAWLGAKSSSFRRETRRKAKRLEQAGAAFRFAAEDTLEQDIAAFLRLHRESTGSSLRSGASCSPATVSACCCSRSTERLSAPRS